MTFTGRMTMTVSTNKGNKKKKRKNRRRKNKLALFAVVFCSVLLAGSLFLAVLAAGQESGQDVAEETEHAAQQQPEPALSEEIKTQEEQPGEEADASEPAEEKSRYGELLADAERMKREKIYAKEAASPEEIVMAFAGDILFDPNYAVMAKLQQRGGAIEEAFSEEILTKMREADIFMVNNEFPYTSRGTPTADKTFTFRAKPESAAYLTEMGVDIVSLANNHSYDYGETSLLDSLDTLEAMDMPYVGAGRNLEEAVEPVNFIINDTKICILSATQIERNDYPDTPWAGENTPGTFRCWNVDRLLQEIAAAREESDIVIVFIHWGTENEEQIDWAQRDQAIAIAEAGADIIIGAHPHCLQPVGYVGEVPVIYSLGNFWFNSKSLDTCLVQVKISKEGKLSVQVLPAKQSDCYTKLLDGEEKQRVIGYLNSISDSGVLDEEGYLGPR